MLAYRTYIHLTSDEWGNEVMRKVADEYAAHHNQRPLIMSVYEHAGWHLSYLYGAPGIPDGTVCGTANDAATISPAVRNLEIEAEYLESIRR